ncbi:MAG: hypothetical protein IKT52_10210 [Oscillospiraceae bacterium]|nr:hypothetical protein [Oscillospiraceae bacterium]
MTDRQLRKASRTDLLKILLEQRKENEALREQLAQAQAQLQQRQITIDQSGTLAEAALKLSGIFDAAETACQYYTENIRSLSGRQEEICRSMEQETREKCDRMLEQAKQMAKVYWDEYTEKCNRYIKSMENARRAADPCECAPMEAL